MQPGGSGLLGIFSYYFIIILISIVIIGVIIGVIFFLRKK